MRKLFIGVGVGALVIVAFLVFRGGSPADLTAVIGGSPTNSETANSSGSQEPSASTGSVAVADLGESSQPSATPGVTTASAPTKSPTATTKSTTTPKPTATPTSTSSSGTGATTGTGTTSTTTTTSSGSKEVVGANNALSVKGTGTVFKLVTNGMTGLTVILSSPATAEVSMTNMAFIVNITSAPILPMTFSFETKAGMEYYVFQNNSSRYALVRVSSSGLMEYSVTSVPSNFQFAAGYEPGTWNKLSPDPVNITVERPLKTSDARIAGTMYWAYDIAKSFRESKGSLSGICDSRELFPAVYQATSSGSEYHCNESAGAFAASVKLPISGKYFCADSVGNKIGSSADLGSATSCK